MVRLRARVHQADHLNRWHGRLDLLGELDFSFCRRAEAGSDLEGFLERPHDLRVTMSQQQRAPGTNIVDVFIPIGVEEMRALAARDENGIAAHTAESPHRRVHAAGNRRLSAAEQLFGSGAGHVRLPPGRSRLSPKLMAISNKLPLRFCSRRFFNPRYDCVPANRSCMSAEKRGLRRVN